MKVKVIKNILFLLSSTSKWILLLFLCLTEIKISLAEGSGTWGTTGQAMLWVPSRNNSGDGNFTSGHNFRGEMMPPSASTGYRPTHRLYVFMKNNETVHWGFRATQLHTSTSSTNTYMRVRWFYDTSDLGLFPDAITPIQGRTQVQYQQYNTVSTCGIKGWPTSAAAAQIGPTQLPGNTGGNNAFSFTNNTGQNRAFWVEITDTSDLAVLYGINLDFWDITETNGTTEVTSGRVYSKNWSISNPNSDKTARSDGPIFSMLEDFAYQADFGFSIPLDNSYSSQSNYYFVEKKTLPRGLGGLTNFYANENGPRNTLRFEENRRSVPLNGPGYDSRSANVQYALFLNDSDPSIWQTSATPGASLNIDYREKIAPLSGVEAEIFINIPLPAIVDILIDFDGDGVYTAGLEIILSENYDGPGLKSIYWNREDANGDELPSGAEVDINGETSHSQFIRVDYDPKWEVQVFPNPFMQEISLRAKELQDFKISMTDMQGRDISLRLKPGEVNQITVETNELTLGVYILTLQNNWKT